MRVLGTISLLLFTLLALQACGQRAALVPPEDRVQDSQSY